MNNKKFKQKSKLKSVGWGDWTPQFIKENWYSMENPFKHNIVTQKRNKNTLHIA